MKLHQIRVGPKATCGPESKRVGPKNVRGPRTTPVKLRRSACSARVVVWSRRRANFAAGAAGANPSGRKLEVSLNEHSATPVASESPQQVLQYNKRSRKTSNSAIPVNAQPEDWWCRRSPNIALARGEPRGPVLDRGVFTVSSDGRLPGMLRSCGGGVIRFIPKIVFFGGDCWPFSSGGYVTFLNQV